MIDDAVGLQRVLSETRTIAVVGMSAKPHRASFGVAQYMRDHGYTIIPVNPAYDTVLGETCYPSLREVPVPVDLVDCFRRPDAMLPIVDDAIHIGARTLWMQLGVINQAAAARAEAAGLHVVMDRCVKIEHARLFAK